MPCCDRSWCLDLNAMLWAAWRENAGLRMWTCVPVLVSFQELCTVDLFLCASLCVVVVGKCSCSILHMTSSHLHHPLTH